MRALSTLGLQQGCAAYQCDSCLLTGTANPLNSRYSEYDCGEANASTVTICCGLLQATCSTCIAHVQRAPLNKPQLQPTCISFWLSGQERLEQLLQSFLLLLYVLTCLIAIETSQHTHLPIACEYLCTGALAAWAWHPTSSVSMSVMFQIAVAGAHLSGLALNHQLLDLGARLVRTVRTAPVYRECLQQRSANRQIICSSYGPHSSCTSPEPPADTTHICPPFPSPST
jgi:hypothetical protein